MTDIQYVYRNDIREKKNTGRGAFHKKCGAKSKKCNFPSDYLSRKEKMAMSGECKTYDMRKFYSWEEFKQFPDDIQLRYLNSLITRYDVTISAIAEEVLHITPSGFYRYLNKKDKSAENEFLKYINKAPNGHSSAAIQGRARLMSEIEKANNPVEETIPEPEVEAPPVEVVESEPIVEAPHVEVTEPEPVIVEKKSLSDIRHVAIDLNGFDDDLWNFFKGCFKNQKVSIHMSIQVKES